MSAPQVSVVMPVRDGERFLAEAVESVLGQTLCDLELIVVDDGSTDGTPVLLAGLARREQRVRVQTQAPGGLTSALNAGCAVASSPYIARMDGDDVALPDRLERQLAYLDAHADVALLGGGIILIDETGAEFDREPGRVTPELTQRNELVHATVVMRTEAFRALGGYRLDQSEDYDLWLRFDERHGIAALEEPVIRYRLHPGQFSVTKLARQALGSLCVRAAARARRAQGPDPLEGVQRVDEAIAERLGSLPRADRPADRQRRCAVGGDAWARRSRSRGRHAAGLGRAGHREPPRGRRSPARRSCSCSSAPCAMDACASRPGASRPGRARERPSDLDGRPRRGCRGGRSVDAPGVAGAGARCLARGGCPADGRTRRAGDRAGDGAGASTARAARRAFRDPGVLTDLALGREDFRFPASRRVLELAPEPPDVVHVHNLHGGYFDLRMLPELARRARPSRHAAGRLAFHRPLCAPLRLGRLARGCGDCPHLRTYPALLRDGTAFNLARKRSIYADVELTVVTPSRWLMDMVERSVLAPAAVRRVVIPNGVDLGVFCPGDRSQARHDLGVAGNVPLVVFSAQGGRVNEFKDFPTLRKALGRLDVPVQAVALGDPVPGRSRSAGRGAGRRRRTPVEVVRWLRAADVYVHPSRADTFPISVLEALACGTAVVASRVGGIPEQVRDETGVLVEPGDPGALAAAIDSLLGDPIWRERMAAAGAEDARRRFSLERQIDAYVELYSSPAEQ